MSYAPDYDVPPNVSPFVPLPRLELCAHCGQAFPPIQSMALVRDGVVHRPLCHDCGQAPA